MCSSVHLELFWTLVVLHIGRLFERFEGTSNHQECLGDLCVHPFALSCSLVKWESLNICYFWCLLEPIRANGGHSGLHGGVLVKRLSYSCLVYDP